MTGLVPSVRVVDEPTSQQRQPVARGEAESPEVLGVDPVGYHRHAIQDTKNANRAGGMISRCREDVRAALGSTQPCAQ